MGNTTFTGAVRSESTFKTVSKNTTTGAITEVVTVGRVILVPDGGQDNTYTLPAPVAGSMFRFVYAGGAADATDAIIVTPANANFFVGGVTFLDTDNEVSAVFSDGNSNSKIQINVPAGFDVTIMGIDATNYQIFGSVTGATAPAFGDQ